MRTLTLPPEQVLVPGEYELHSEDLLKVYFRIFERGHGQDLPPVLVCPSNLLSLSERSSLYLGPVRESLGWLRSHLGGWLADYTEDDSIDSLLAKVRAARSGVSGVHYGYCEDVERDMLEYRERIAAFEQRIGECSYFLLDGNHRSAAATLAHQPIYALEIKTDEDLAEARRMVDRGELFNFERPESSVKEVYTSFVHYLVGEQASQFAGHMDDLRTVKERIDGFASGDDLPGYMKERYSRR